MGQNGFVETRESIYAFVNKTKNPYLTCTDIDENKWLGISHCTIREKMKNKEMPCLKVGVAFKIHYLDLIQFIEETYEQKNI